MYNFEEITSKWSFLRLNFDGTKIQWYSDRVKMGKRRKIAPLLILP